MQVSGEVVPEQLAKTGKPLSTVNVTAPVGATVPLKLTVADSATMGVP